MKKLTYKSLKKQFPEDATCAFCGKKNRHWDQDGFFYLRAKPDMRFDDASAACKECIEGEPGRLHAKLHGKGDGKR